MSRVEAVRKIFDEWARGDFSSTTSTLDEHALLVIHDDFPDWGLYLGLEQIAGYMRGLLGGFSEFTMTAEGFLDAGDTVVVQVRQRGVGPASGIATEIGYSQLLTFRGDLIVRIESLVDRDRALAMAGLSG
jgi:ketosteroid isomerase-like protein